MNEGKWFLSEDEETFNVGPFNTREEALAKAVEELRLSPGARFWVGMAVPPADILSADWVAQCLAEYAEGEGPEDASYNFTTEAAEELDVLLAVWKGKHSVRPLWMEIQDVTEHEAPPLHATA